MPPAPETHATAKGLGGLPPWLLLISLVAALGAWSGWNAYDDYLGAIEQGYRMLEVQARQREARISGSLRSVSLMLGSIVEDLQERPTMSVAENNRLLRNYLRQLPELRNLLIEDASGRIIAEARETSIGMDASTREYFKFHRAAPQNDEVHVSRPFKALSGLTATTLSRAMRNKQGKFAGVALASLDAGFFSDALKLSAYESGVRATLINLHGDIIGVAPFSDLVGQNLQGGIAFTEHMTSGQATTRHRNVTKLEKVEKMAVFHNLPDAPLAVIVSRDYDRVLAEWSQSMVVHVGSFLLLAVGVLFFFGLAARRQRSLVGAHAQLAERELELRTIIESEPECVKQLSEDGRLLDMNQAGLAMIEADSLDEVVGKDMLRLVLPEYRKAFMALTRKVFAGESGDLTFELAGLKGGRRWLETHAAPLRNSQGQVTALLGVTRDITERRKMEEQVRQMAFHDTLTGLPNRRLLSDRLNQTMATTKRSGCYAALIFLDLDNFKPLNDRHGHAAGDLLLIEVADRLRSCVREMDSVGRFGGDEFVVMLGELNANRDASTTQARIVAEKIRATLSQPYKLRVGQDGKADAEIEHCCTASMGIALFIDHQASEDDILKWADSAMYQAKEVGPNQIRFHDAQV